MNSQLMISEIFSVIHDLFFESDHTCVMMIIETFDLVVLNCLNEWQDVDHVCDVKMRQDCRQIACDDLEMFSCCLWFAVLGQGDDGFIMYEEVVHEASVIEVFQTQHFSFSDEHAFCEYDQ
jgi:hypothetical protein